MSSISLHRPLLATALLAASVALAVAAPLKSQAAPKAQLLQANEQQPMKGVQWFAEDAQRIAQMPPFISDPKHPVCSPICTYACGHNECDQTCEPLCLPPQCETLCAKSEDKCATRCSKPKCAVICPLQPECVDDSACPKAKCRTICAPPACTTSCSDSCHSVCTQPQCTWKCKSPKCPKPACKMTCPDMSRCREQLPIGNLTKVPIMPGMDIKAEDQASLDPAVLTEPVEAPPAGPETIPQKHKDSTLGRGMPPPQTTPGPVKMLKMHWKAQDLHNENERLLRR